jgi:hypothetical protein
LQKYKKHVIEEVKKIVSMISSSSTDEEKASCYKQAYDLLEKNN